MGNEENHARLSNIPEECGFRWGLKGTFSVEKKCRYYKSFISEGTEYCVFDDVYVNEKEGPLPIGKIISMREHFSTKVKDVLIRWYLRPCELPDNVPGVDYSSGCKEIFLAYGTMHGRVKTWNDPMAIISKCKVIYAASSLTDVTGVDHFFRRAFDMDSLAFVINFDELLAKLGNSLLGNNVTVSRSTQADNVSQRLTLKGTETGKGGHDFESKKRPRIDSGNRKESTKKPKLTVDDQPDKSSGKSQKNGSIPRHLSNRLHTTVQRPDPVVGHADMSTHITDHNARNDDISTREKYVPSNHSLKTSWEINLDDSGESLGGSNRKCKENQLPFKNLSKAHGKSKSAMNRHKENCESKKDFVDKRASYAVGESSHGKAPVNRKTTTSSNLSGLHKIGTKPRNENFVKPSDELDYTSRLPSEIINDLNAIREQYKAKAAVRSTFHPNNRHPPHAGKPKPADRDIPAKLSKEVLDRPADVQKKTSRRSDKHGSLRNDERARPIPELAAELISSIRLNRLGSDLRHCNERAPLRDQNESAAATLDRRESVPERKSFFKPSSWEEDLEDALRTSRVLYFENLDPFWSSSDLEEVLKDTVQAIKARTLIPKSYPYISSVEAFALFRTARAAEEALEKLEENCLLLSGDRPVNASLVTSGTIRFKVDYFCGFFNLDKFNMGNTENQSKAQATSHCSQPNTIEFEMGLTWRLLQEQHALGWTMLHEVHKKDYKRLCSSG